MEGLSVIIVCHNGASRLPTTLTHLRLQESSAAPWEVLVIDNASTDGTAEVARSCWQNGPAPLRVINESRLGVRYARERGFFEARYEFLGFVDDDNWVAQDWVRTAYDIITSDAGLGAVGSIRTPACEVSSPAWFDNFHSPYAVLTEQDLEQIDEPLDYLPTAGLCVRKAAWDRLIQNGFRFQLTGTVGKKLQGGEDAELTIAFRLSGWKLRIDPRLRLQHFMPSQRLRWTYLRKLLRDYGASHVPLDAYTEHSLSLGPGARRWMSDHWWYQLWKSVRKIASRPSTVMAALSSDGEGRNDIVEVEQQFGRALGLLRLRRRYGALRREVREARWRRLECFEQSLLPAGAAYTDTSECK
jgi:glycosyltransferase involved in cell wall biosynthesis